MSEKPIIFNGEMVRAILDGRKSQTRRLVKPQPSYCGRTGKYEWDARGQIGVVTMEEAPMYAPWYRSDLLWVRETWQHNPFGGIVYKAGSGIVNCGGRGWRPSIHMPRWASRITLEVTGVRVERVQSITEEDAQYEGVERPVLVDFGPKFHPMTGEYRDAFRKLWDSLYPDSWEHNDWVWVISFRKVKP